MGCFGKHVFCQLQPFCSASQCSNLGTHTSLFRTTISISPHTYLNSFHVVSLNKVQKLHISEEYMKINVYLCTHTRALKAQEAYLNTDNFSFFFCLLATGSQNSFSRLFPLSQTSFHLPVYIISHLLSWRKSNLHQDRLNNSYQNAGTYCTDLTISFRSRMLLGNGEALTTCATAECWLSTGLPFVS